MSDFDTIAAIATAPGEGGVAVIRISGPKCFAIADAVFACPPPLPSRRSGGTFVHGRAIEADGSPIDEGLLLIMRAPRSYTREDTVEIQGHGGPVVARRILDRVLSAGARSAEPGEFTKRAFLNGRIDLTRAEAVLDLIRARSDRAAAAAMDQLDGRLAGAFNGLYDRLMVILGNIEATLDFSEQELPPDIFDPVAGSLRDIVAESDCLLATWNEGHMLRDGVTVVIAGSPNVGKSTLLNALFGRPRAIVSDQPGTTRDTIEEQLVLGGYPITLVDTAGLRATTCEVELEGIRRTRDEIERADLCLYVFDASLDLNQDDLEARNAMDPKKTIFVCNKSDISASRYTTIISASAISLAGVESLRGEIVRRLDTQVPHSTHHAAISSRHRDLLVTSKELIKSALDMAEKEGAASADIIASQLRAGAEQLGHITGREFHQNLLEAIFSRFCIGK